MKCSACVHYSSHRMSECTRSDRSMRNRRCGETVTERRIERSREDRINRSHNEVKMGKDNRYQNRNECVWCWSRHKTNERRSAIEKIREVVLEYICVIGVETEGRSGCEERDMRRYMYVRVCHSVHRMSTCACVHAEGQSSDAESSRNGSRADRCGGR